MKQSFHTFIKMRSSSFVNYIIALVSKISVMAIRNGGRALVNYFIRISWLMGLDVNLSLVKVILSFCFECSRIGRKSGIRFLVSYLKTCLILLQKHLSGDSVRDLSPFGSRPSRTGDGLPRIIPALHRARIRNGETGIIQFWITLLSLYRALMFPGQLKLTSITNPGIPFDSSSLVGFIPTFFTMLQAGYYKVPHILATLNLTIHPFLILKSTSAVIRKGLGRISSTSLIGLLFSCKLILESPLWPLISQWLKITKNRSIYDLIWKYGNNSLYDYVRRIFPSISLGYLGKLGFKQEPAGKVRVFAMVDAITQWMFKPIHSLIFRILSLLKEDGTFDQLRPIHRLLSIIPSGMALYSFDLSSATDRLPLSIQQHLLAFIIGDKLASLWASILTDRTYSYNHPRFGSGFVRYAIGQPMGALSSWAMLAFTHHFLVQYAYYRAYGKIVWYKYYAILGDDLVIADVKVATAYLSICKTIGLDINMSKSLRSYNGTALEFAKRTFYMGVDVSATTLRSYIMAISNLSALADLAKGHKLNLNTFLNVLGKGYRAKSIAFHDFIWLKLKHRRLANALILYSSPYCMGLPIPFEEFFYLKSVHSFYPKEVFGSDRSQTLLRRLGSHPLAPIETLTNSLRLWIFNFHRFFGKDLKHLNTGWVLQELGKVSLTGDWVLDFQPLDPPFLIERLRKDWVIAKSLLKTLESARVTLGSKEYFEIFERYANLIDVSRLSKVEKDPFTSTVQSEALKVFWASRDALTLTNDK